MHMEFLIRDEIHLNAQIIQYGQLLSGIEWKADSRIQPLLFASNLTGENPIAPLQPNIWQRISIIFFVLYFIVLVCFSACRYSILSRSA